MPAVYVNYVAVLVAAIVQMGVGMLWYGPLFGKAWMKLVGLTKKDTEKAMKEGMAKTYFISFLGALVSAYVLAYLVGAFNAASAIEGATIGFWAWTGFVATTQLTGVLWEGKTWNLYYLDVAYQLVALLLMGGLLAAWV